MDKKHLYITTFILVIGGIAATLIPGWSSKEPDVRFFLSDPIPLRFGGTENGAVQQLTITNKGNATATQIRIKLPPRIVDHQLDKAYESDESRVVIGKESFEVLYPLLAKQDQFRLIVKTDGAAITHQELSIQHATGTAIDALTPNRSLLIQFLGPLAILILPGTMLGLIVFDLSLTSWKWKAEGYDTWEEFLKRPKPFWVTSTKWSKLRLAAIATCKCSNFTRIPLNQTKYYIILNSDKPSHVDHTEWDVLKASLTDKLEGEISERCSRIYSAKDVEELLAVQRPALFPNDRWTEFVQKLQSLLIKEKKRELNSSLIRPNLEEIFALLNEPAPNGMDSMLWASWTQEIRESYYRWLYQELALDDDPIDTLKKYDLTFLDINQRARIENFATTRALIRVHRNLAYLDTKHGAQQQQPEWMEDSVFSFYQAFYKKAAASEKASVASGAIIKNLKRITHGIDLDETDKDQMSPDDWENLNEIHAEIVESKRVTQAKEKELRETSAATLSDRSIILRQLDILNRLLGDPKSIFQVEDYDNPFASGNFAMLKILATKLIYNPIIKEQSALTALASDPRTTQERQSGGAGHLASDLNSGETPQSVVRPEA